MRRRFIAAVLITAAAAVPATASAAHPAPRAAALENYSSVWQKCKVNTACQAGRNVRKHGVRFKWTSEDGSRSHWGSRPAHARDVSRRIRSMRSQLAVSTLTPYAGPGGTRWAIPWYIVSCESHGSWGAANPSGAIGPYQLLGKGAPWPANSAAARLEHHRIAHNLWAGGAGAHHWVCA